MLAGIVQTGGAVPIVQGSVHNPIWLPDGKSIAYRLAKNGGQFLLVRNLETGQEKEIYRVSLPTGLAISPDGNYLAFEEHGTEGTSWKVIPTEGGRPRELCRTQGARGGMTWTADSRQLLFVSGGELASVSIEGGEPRKLGLNMKGLREIQLHPDGKRLAFTAGEPKAELWALENFLPTTRAGARP